MADAGGVSTATAQGVRAAHAVVVSHRTSRNDGSCPTQRPQAQVAQRTPLEEGSRPRTRIATRALVTLIASLVADAVKVLAGQETIAEFVLRVLVPLRIKSWTCYVILLTALGFAAHQYRLRQRAIAEVARRIVDLARLLDPARTSSQLTSTGDTRPEDR